jgi:hypothetical protein
MYIIFTGVSLGKTKVIAEKVLHFIEYGFLPWENLDPTFSDKAAKEMLDLLEEWGTWPHNPPVHPLNSLVQKYNAAVTKS